MSVERLATRGAGVHASAIRVDAGPTAREKKGAALAAHTLQAVADKHLPLRLGIRRIFSLRTGECAQHARSNCVRCRVQRPRGQGKVGALFAIGLRFGPPCQLF